MKKQALHSFRSRLRQIERELEDFLKNGPSCCNVSLSQCHAILEIGETGPTSITRLTNRLKLDKSTLSRTIDNLVKSGLVERITDPDDRRFVQVALSSRGIKICNDINTQCDDFYMHIFQYIPENEHGKVMEVMNLLSHALRKSKMRADKERSDICQSIKGCC